jgi:hypothetical protein
MRIMSGVVAVLGVTLAAVAAPARADTTIATVPRVTPVTGYGGHLVWSAYDEPSGDYRLIHRGADGNVAPLPVAGRSVPFDADLGPGRDGRPALVYSRCAAEPPVAERHALAWHRARGCDVYRFSFETGRETRVAGASRAAASEFLPAVWRGRIAFGLRRAGTTVPAVRLLEADRAARSMPGPPERVCARFFEPRRRTEPLRCGRARQGALTALDLRGRAVAFAWQVIPPGAELSIHHWRFDVYLSTAAGRRRIATARPGGMIQVVQRWPAFDGRYLTWSESCFGAPGECPPGRHRFWRYRLADGSGSSAEAPRYVLAQTAAAGRFTYIAASREPPPDNPCAGDGPGPARVCQLRQTGPIRFELETPARSALRQR